MNTYIITIKLSQRGIKETVTFIKDSCDINTAMSEIIKEVGHEFAVLYIYVEQYKNT